MFRPTEAAPQAVPVGDVLQSAMRQAAKKRPCASTSHWNGDAAKGKGKARARVSHALIKTRPAPSAPAPAAAKNKRVRGKKKSSPEVFSLGEIARKAIARFERPAGMKDSCQVMRVVIRAEDRLGRLERRLNRNVLPSYILRRLRTEVASQFVLAKRANDILVSLVAHIWDMVQRSELEGEGRGCELRRFRSGGRDIFFRIRKTGGKKPYIVEAMSGRHPKERYTNRRQHKRGGRSGRSA